MCSLSNFNNVCYAQAIRDGVIEASIDHEQGFMRSKVGDISINIYIQGLCEVRTVLSLSFPNHILISSLVLCCEQILPLHVF